MKLLLCVGAVLVSFGSACAQMQLPPGTSAVDDRAQQSVAQPADASAVAKAEEAITKSDYATAIALLRPLAEQQPKNSGLLYDLAYAEDASDDTADAHTHYTAALAANPNNADAHVSLGLLMARAGDAKSAEEQLNAAVAIPDADPALKARAFRALARLQIASNPVAARDAMVAALKLSPESAQDTLLSGEIAETMGDEAAAEKAFVRYMQATKGAPDAVAAYGRALAREGNLDQAESTLEQGLADHPGDPQITTELASLYVQRQQLERAVPLLEDLHAKDASNAAVTRMLAHAYVALDRPRQAVPLYQSLLSETPNDVSLQADLGDALVRMRQYPEAEQQLAAAVAHPDAFPSPGALGQAAAALAFAAMQNSEPQTTLRAVAVHDKAVAPDAATTFLAATAYDTLHQRPLAISAYAEFLKLANGKLPDQEWQARQRILALHGHLPK